MIYVDRYLDGVVPDFWKGGGHMLATDIEELHRAARVIGLRREWFQDKSFPHYDLTEGRRTKLLAMGKGGTLALAEAVVTEIEPGELPLDVLMRKRDGTYEPRSERMARRGLEKLLDS